jgi:Tol biopolymer transport system component
VTSTVEKLVGRTPRLAIGGLVVVLVALVVLVQLAAASPGRFLLGIFPDSTQLHSSATHRASFHALNDSLVRARLGDLFLPGNGALMGEGGTVPAFAVPRAPSVPNSLTTIDHPLTNDNFDSAYPVEQVPFRAHVDTTGSTRESGEPATCAPVGGTVWYRFRAPQNTVLTTNTFGSDFSTALGVFTGSSLTSLSQVACSVSTGGNAYLNFGVAAGQTYYFQVAGPLKGGSLTFFLDNAGATLRASVTSNGRQVYGDSIHSDISRDGHFVLFVSTAIQFADDRRKCPDSTYTCSSLVLHDLLSGTTRTLLTTAYVTSGGSGSIGSAAISADGQFVAFDSNAANLVPGKKTTNSDVFVYNLKTGGLERVSGSWQGGDAWGTGSPHALGPSLSADGRYVFFVSNYRDLFPGEPAPGGQLGDQLFVRDRQTGKTELVSVNPDGVPLDGDSNEWNPRSISDDGRFVAFDSDSSNLPFQAPGCRPQDVASTCYYLALVWDRTTHRSSVISRPIPGRPFVDGDSFGESVAPDGSHVAFGSLSDDLVANDTNLLADVFEWTTADQSLTRVSVSSDGVQQQGDVNGSALSQPYINYRMYPSLSRDGRYVAFNSPATNLVSDPSNGKEQVYIHDILTGATIRCSLAPDATIGNDDSFHPELSADANFLTFTSAATNLVPNDTNHNLDIFVRRLPF